MVDFGPSAVDTGGQFGNWSGWFGHQQNARVAIRLEFDRLATAANLIEAGEVRATWHDGNLRKQYVPGERDTIADVGCSGEVGGPCRT